MIKSNSSYWAKSGFYSLGSRISALLFNFGGFYILVRYLPQNEFGIWALFLTMSTIFETSRNGLIQNGLIKLIHSNLPKDLDKVITASWIINVFFSTVLYSLILLFFGITNYGSDEMRSIMFYYGIILLLQIPFSQFNYLQHAKFSFSGIFWSTVARQGMFFLATLIIYFGNFEISLKQLVFVQAGCTFFGLIVAYKNAKPYINFNFQVDTTIIKQSFHFGKFVMGTNLSSLVFKSTDQLTIGALMDSRSLALYNSSIRLSNLVEYPSTSIAEVIYPKSAAKFKEGLESVNRDYYEKSVALTILITLPMVIATFLFADEIIYFIAGPLYEESAKLLRVTSLFGILTPFSRQFGVSMDSSGRPQINFSVVFFGLLLNILTNYIGVKFFGTIGAAFGTLFSLVVVNVICYYLMVKIFDVSIIRVINFIGYYLKHGYLVAIKWKTGE